MLLIYNLLNSFMWACVIFKHNSILLYNVQMAGLLDIVFAGVGIIKSNPVVVAKQISSRIAIIVLTHYSENTLLLSGLCITWGIADCVRYFHQVSNIDFLRYNLFYVLYPVGITLELLCYFYYPKYYIIDKLWPLILAVYLMYGPGMYNHMIIQRRKKALITLLNDNLTTRPNPYIIHYDKKTYNTHFVNADVARVHISEVIPVESIYLANKKDKIILKDLGLQVSWRGVFICEYFGPLLIPFLFNPSMNIAIILWSLHYAKRIYESIYLHSFSSNYMPFSNLFKNSLYYWGAAYYVSLDIINFNTQLNIMNSILIVMWLFAQTMNYKCHAYLAGLRKDNTGDRYKLPTWGPFKYVACPNYTYEVFGWVIYTLLTHSVASLVFTIIGLVQMTVWAKKKYNRNKQLFLQDYTVKHVIIPYVL